LPSKQSIKSFWNKAAEENPYWFVSSFGPYNKTRNLDEFWASGQMIWADLKRASGYKPTPNDTVLEIGCGIGRLTRVIAPEVSCVIAIDISENMLAIAREARLPNADFRIAEGFSLPGIPNGSVDLALGYCVFQHLPSHSALESYLVEMCRVTKPRGLIAFTLGPRDWKAWLLPVLRVRAYIREKLKSNGPKGIYQKEWVGIRPSASQVSRISPMPLERKSLDVGRILYFGRVPAGS
jgi:ubiquinone/menaquinone biosynthesis C-methylase UbiE